MRLLDRYLLREFVPPLVVILCGVLALWISFDLLGRLDGFQEDGLGAADIAEHYFVEVPSLLGEVLMPASLMLALLYSVTRLARHNELVAIRAAGVGTWRLLMPFLAVGLLAAMAVFLGNEWWMPDHQLRQDEIRARHSRADNDAPAHIVKNFQFRNDRSRRAWTIGEYNLLTGHMTNVYIQWPRTTNIVEYIAASTAVPMSSRGFRLTDVRRRIYHVDRRRLVDEELREETVEFPEFEETVEQIASEYQISQLSRKSAIKRPSLSLSLLQNYFELHPNLGERQAALLFTQFHGRIAQPFANVVVVLLVFPFAMPGGRRNIFIAVAGAIAIAFSYFVLQRVGLSLGVSGALPPWFAAWLPNLFFAGIGVVLINRVR